jgi:hypothetical protein
MISLCLLIAAFFFMKEIYLYSQKTLAVGEGSDRFYTSPRPLDKVMSQALDWLEKNATEKSTLTVIPEGQILNYLTRRPDPTRYPHFLFLAILNQGEKKIIEDFERAKPSFIVVAPADWSEYGEDYFGGKAGAGKELLDWIQDHYKKAAAFQDGNLPPLEIYAA